MIRLGLRLTVNGGREAAVRLLLTTAAVAIGVGLLLAALGGMNAINAQNSRTVWLNTSVFGNGPGPGLPGAANIPSNSGQADGSYKGPAPSPPVASNPSAGSGGSSTVSGSKVAPLWWLFSADRYRSKTIDRVDVAGTGSSSPVPPGISALPAPGHYYASPALSQLLKSVPATELGNRFPGVQIGTIGPAALPSPNSLIIIVGRTAAELSKARAEQVTSINTTTGHSGGPNGLDANKLQIILAVGALALLFPVLILIGTATRLAAARREQRFAAMRLVGATPHQVSNIAAVEASVAAVGGVILGFGVFFGLRPLLTNVAFTGQRFASGDISIGPADIVLVAVGVPLAAAIAARVATRRAQASPLGVVRRVTPPAPRAYRLLPLVVGVAELAYFVAVGRPKTTGSQIEAYFSGCLLIMGGLVIAGPWLTMVGSRIVIRRANRPAALIAGRRLADNPRAAFRSISGLIVALFVTSISAGIITTILANRAGLSSGTGTNETLVAQFGARAGQHSNVTRELGVSANTIPAALPTELRAITHVQGVTVLYAASDQATSATNRSAPVLVACDDLLHTPALGRCPSGATVATITGSLDSTNVTGKSTLAATVWPASPTSLDQLQSLPVAAIAVTTHGSSQATEQARTLLEVAFPGANPPATIGEINAANERTVLELQQLTNVVIIVSLLVAGCSLAVSVTAGVNDRKRPFSLLRLSGVPVQALRGIVALEAVVPLVLVAALSIGTGFLAADLFLRSQLSETLQPPGRGYIAIVLAGLVISLALIAATLPLIERITGPETARSE